MNIFHLTQAVADLQAAVPFTIDPAERKAIQAAEAAVLLILRRRGVFIGPSYKTEERPEIEQIQDALDNYWRTQPDTLAAVNAVMKDVNEYRMEKELFEGLLHHALIHAAYADLGFMQMERHLKIKFVDFLNNRDHVSMADRLKEFIPDED